MGTAQVIQFANDDLLAAAVAEAWLSAVGAAQADRHKYLVALSGGRITRKLFAATVQQAQERKIVLQGVEFFWADERCVPPSDPESNFLLADELLFKPARIQRKAIHRIQGEREAAEAARLASEELSLIADKKCGSIPMVDLVLLGMGEDGHVASLFPGDLLTAQDSESVFLAVNNSPKPPANRVTLGYGAIAAAREVWVLASGRGKEPALRQSLSSNGQTPLARVIQQRAVTKIFSDISL